MLAKGYVLSKDALIKAKAMDESYGFSVKAAAKDVELDNRIGINDKISAGIKAVYHVVEITKTGASVTGNAAVSAATFKEEQLKQPILWWSIAATLPRVFLGFWSLGTRI